MEITSPHDDLSPSPQPLYSYPEIFIFQPKSDLSLLGADTNFSLSKNIIIITMIAIIIIFIVKCLENCYRLRRHRCICFTLAQRVWVSNLISAKLYIFSVSILDTKIHSVLCNWFVLAILYLNNITRKLFRSQQ